jgi:hypothetical protein
MPDRISFTRPAVARIANVVRTVEGARKPGDALAFDAIMQQRRVFRVCTFTGTWAVDTEKTLKFYHITNTPNTITAHNIFADIKGGTSSACMTNCAIAKNGSAWYLIAAGCQCE